MSIKFPKCLLAGRRAWLDLSKKLKLTEQLNTALPFVQS